MPRRRAETVDAYLRSLSADQRDIISQIRGVILEHLPKGYRESMNWGAITYEIPLERYPDTYNGQPLAYVSLAAQKNYSALYLMGVYGDPKQRALLTGEFKKRGKKLDMGKSCLRFKRLEDLPLDVIGRIIAATPPDAYIATYEASAAARRKRATRTPRATKAKTGSRPRKG